MVLLLRCRFSVTGSAVTGFRVTVCLRGIGTRGVLMIGALCFLPLLGLEGCVSEEVPRSSCLSRRVGRGADGADSHDSEGVVDISFFTVVRESAIFLLA